MAPYDNFELPGLVNNPITKGKMVVALASSYSAKYNLRRLEHDFYGVWNMVLSCLISDMESMLVVPQHLIFYVPDTNLPDYSFETIAQARAKELTPDFVITCSRSQQISARHPPDPSRWHRVKVPYKGFPLLCENKRPPSRSAVGPIFNRQLGNHMLSAVNQVEKQAKNLFHNNLHNAQQSIVLIANCGEWWMFRVMTRHDEDYEIYEEGNILDGLKDKEDKDKDCGDDYEDDPMEDGNDGNEPGHPADEIEEAEMAQEEPSRPCIDVAPEREEQLVENIEDAWPGPDTDGWSGFMRLGTPVSNQRMYLIHKRLADLNRDRYNETSRCRG